MAQSVEHLTLDFSSGHDPSVVGLSPKSGSMRSMEPVKILSLWGAWVAQLVEHPTLDFGSGHDLMVGEFSPHIRFCADSVEPAWNSLCPFPAVSK